MNPAIQQIRRLSWILLFSLTINVSFITGLLYNFLTDFSTEPVYPKVSAAQTLATKAELTAAILALKGLGIDELRSKLTDRRVVENGFTVGDLALSSLVGFYFFDVERAIKHPLEKAVLSYGDKGETLVVYPGLSDTDFATLDKFRKEEKWPFRAQGLFRLLKSDKFKDDPSLKEAFFLTPEFRSVELILARAPVKVDKNETLELILSQEWGKTAAFHENQKKSLDLSEGARRLFLLSAIDEQNSAPAARLLLKTDRDFALKKLEDKITVKILSLLKDHKELIEGFGSELVKTPRSEAVKRATTAYSAPRVVPPIKKNAASPSKERIYIVQKNETLKSIAKQFNLNIDILRKMNGLSTDDLKAGRPLRVPAL